MASDMAIIRAVTAAIDSFEQWRTYGLQRYTKVSSD